MSKTKKPKSVANGRLGVTASTADEPQDSAPVPARKVAAFKVSLDLLAKLKAVANTLDIDQSSILDEALAAHLEALIDKSDKKAVIQELYKIYRK